MGKESLATISARVDDLVFSEASETKAVAKLEELLEAKIIVRGIERTPSGSPIYEERPDSGIQLAAAVKIIEYRRGKPKQMVEVNTTPPGAKAQGLQELGRLLTKNPELALKVIQTLKQGIDLSQAIDVTSTSKSSPSSPPESQSGGSPSQES